jgi:hypothetical protein
MDELTWTQVVKEAREIVKAREKILDEGRGMLSEPGNAAALGENALRAVSLLRRIVEAVDAGKEGVKP